MDITMGDIQHREYQTFGCHFFDIRERYAKNILTPDKWSKPQTSKINL
jgi:hypothetical protein